MIQSNRATAQQIDTDVLTLPARVRARDGGEFDPNLDEWSFRTAKNRMFINFGRVSQVAVASLVYGLKATLAWFAANRSDDATRNAFDRVIHFLRFCNSADGKVVRLITAEHVLSYRASLPPEQQWYLSVLSGVLKKWHALGYPGVDQRVPDILRELRLKGNTKGQAVATLDPNVGPFSAIELEAIQGAVNDAFAKAVLGLREYVLVWLFMLIGPRPSQIALLKVCDFRTVHSSDGTLSYMLRVPRAKQRHAVARTAFTERIIAPQIGALLATYVEQAREAFDDKLADPNEAPLFPALRSTSEAPDGYQGHAPAVDLARLVQSSIEKLMIMSERTGLAIKITMTRFRRTLGTRAAMEGHGELVIAELLDHSDTQNVGVYVASRPEIVDRIDKAIALKMAPMAQAFAGMIVTDESDAERGDDPTSRIVHPGLSPSMQPMGTCGKHGFCGLAAPIACYTCRNFQPWVDGPHEAVLDHLLEERERLGTTGDLRIASINDRTILAVAEVVRQCAAMQGQPGGQADG
ncbi:MAG: site-specific integrase [Hyphomicrobiaceae bacterium]